MNLNVSGSVNFYNMLQHSVRQIGGCHVTLFELHSKQTIGISTKRLPVTEIAPTANELPRDQTDTGGIQQLKEILLGINEVMNEQEIVVITPAITPP